MKRCFQLVALLAVVLLGSCTGGKDKSAAEKTEEKPKVKLADVTARPVEQIQEYTATVEAEVKNNIAPSSPVRIDKIFVCGSGRSCVQRPETSADGCCQLETD